MNLQELYKLFTSTLARASDEELNQIANQAAEDSRDSYIMGGMEIFDDEDTFEQKTVKFVSNDYVKSLRYYGSRYMITNAFRNRFGNEYSVQSESGFVA